MRYIWIMYLAKSLYHEVYILGSINLSVVMEYAWELACKND
jgi:hypothetical protein